MTINVSFFLLLLFLYLARRPHNIGCTEIPFKIIQRNELLNVVNLHKQPH